MDRSAFNHSFADSLNGSSFMWLAAGIPALIAWILFGLAILLAPHLANDPVPLLWAFYGAAGWYLFMSVIFGGWLGLLLIASL